MSVLRAVRKLVLGETWVIPLGLLLLVGGGALLRAADRGLWHAAGPVLLPAGALAVLALAVRATVPRR